MPKDNSKAKPKAAIRAAVNDVRHAKQLVKVAKLRITGNTKVYSYTSYIVT